jgi:hypothetical protein
MVRMFLIMNSLQMYNQIIMLLFLYRFSLMDISYLVIIRNLVLNLQIEI